MNTIQLVFIPIGQFNNDLLELIADDVSGIFQCNVEIVESHVDLSPFYDPARRQYNANKLLKLIEGVETKGDVKKIGLFKIDLFIPILTYIYGQATLNGNTGIVSMYRLRNELYGLEEDPELLLERIKKVVIHELGHIFGLKHCLAPACVMNSSTYVEDLDQKDRFFCKSCEKSLTNELY